MTAPSLSMRVAGGRGRIAVQALGPDVSFSELSASYPLKLLSTRVFQEGVAIVYILTYGGGLVGGDVVDLHVDIGPGCKLLLLTQGSTKVFKTRPGTRAAIHRGPRCEGTTTRNEMDVTVSASGAVFLLPDPATCFRSASYVQIQTIRLAGDASVVLLDWITSGRKSLGEEWAFSRYYSVNELWVDGKRAVKDVLLLEEGDEGKEAAGGGTPRSLSAKLAPYSCYATLILYGPQVQGVIRDLSDAYKAIVVFKCAAPADLVWSLSPIASGDGCVIRVAGKETEGVKHWLRDALLRLQDLVGIDVYRRTFV